MLKGTLIPIVAMKTGAGDEITEFSKMNSISSS